MKRSWVEETVSVRHSATLVRWSRSNWRAADEQEWSSAVRDPTKVPRRRRASAVAVVRALGRVEGRRLVFSPWFAVGLGMCVVMVLSFAPTYDGHESWWDIVHDLPFLAHPLVGMTVLAAHRNATRAERDGAEELFTGTPASGARALGVLASAWVPACALALFGAAYLAMVGAFTSVDGRIGAATVPTVLGATVMGAGGVALGVALARASRSVIAPIVAVVAVGYVSLRLGHGSPGEYRPRMLLSTFGTSLPDDAPELAVGRAWLHLGWLVVITGATAVLAVAGRQFTAAAPNR